MEAKDTWNQWFIWNNFTFSALQFNLINYINIWADHKLTQSLLILNLPAADNSLKYIRLGSWLLNQWNGCFPTFIWPLCECTHRQISFKRVAHPLYLLCAFSQDVRQYPNYWLVHDLLRNCCFYQVHIFMKFFGFLISCRKGLCCIL